MRLDDKVAVVTGGSSGIGKAIATSFSSHGARVAVFGRTLSTLAAVANDLGEHAVAVAGDVNDLRDLDRLFQTTAEKIGAVDLLVVNAGGISFTPLGQTTEADFDEASDLNFKSVFFTVQASLPHLSDGASVIIVGNALTPTPIVGPSVAIAAKAATKSLARTFAIEVAPRNIRVNVLSPGPTAEPTPTGEPDEMTRRIANQTPLGRWGTPEDVANAALFLASDGASHITGADLPVGGGIGMGWIPPPPVH